MADMKLWQVEFNDENPTTKRVYLVGALDIYAAVIEAKALDAGLALSVNVHPGPVLNNWPSLEATVTKDVLDSLPVKP